jgi:hypothetical protein
MLLAGCGQGAGTVDTVEPAAAAASACPRPGGAGSSRTIIDYVNFVQLDGVQYVAGMGDGPDTLRADQLSGRVGSVLCRLDNSDASPSYRARDGDAAFLPPGTVVYAVKGDPAAVAARAGGRFLRYTAFPPATPTPPRLRRLLGHHANRRG